METSLRLIEVGDAAEIAAHRARDRKEFAAWEPAAPDDFYTEAGQRDRVEKLLAGHRAGDRWPGVILADGAVIGQVTVSTIIRGPFGKGFLGYWVGVPYQGRGHASRAVGLALRVMAGELGLRRAEAHTQLANEPSQRVLRNNGFTTWGVAHDHIFVNGAWRDEVFWERLLGDLSP